MSRAFSPPDTLSNENVRTVADVRRRVWINGLFGLAAGSLTCSVGHLMLQKLQQRYVGAAESLSKVATEGATKGKDSLMHRWLKALPPLGRNTFLLSLLGGGALGSFVMSTTAGKNAVHLLHPIFELGRDEHAGQSPYQVALNKAKQSESSLNETQTTEEDELDASHHRARSLRRKLSIKKRLESGHSLSSTHTTWPYDEEEGEEIKKQKGVNRAEAWERRQTQRREWVHAKIERGRALSDSTGGHWDEK